MDAKGAGPAHASRSGEATSGGGEFLAGIIFGTVFASVLGLIIFGPGGDEWTEWMTFDRVTRILELMVLTGGLYSLVLLRRQFVEQTRQHRDDAKWRKLLSYHDYFARFPPDDARDEFVRLVQDRKLTDRLRGKGAEFTESEAKELTDDSGALSIIRSYLDGYEQFCGAVNCAVIDEDYAYSLEGTRVIRIRKVMRHVIEILQASNRKAYIELERLADEWEKRRQSEERDSKHRDGVKRQAPAG